MLIAALLINSTNIRCHASVSSKKRALEKLSMLLAQNTEDISQEQIFNALLERERLGSTGLGKGVAIPHARLPNLKHTVAAMLTLDEPVNFDAVDSKPVDILFGLLVPAGEDNAKHLQHLSRLVKLFRDAEICQQIREANSAERIFEILLSADDD